MADKYLPPDIPIVYRGGASLKFRPQEVRIDRTTGLVRETHGISVDSDADDVIKFGGAYRVMAIPVELTIVKRGMRKSHFEIVPRSPMSPEKYQKLLDQIELEERKHDEDQ